MTVGEKLRVISDFGFTAMRPEITAVVEAAERIEAMMWEVGTQATEHDAEEFALRMAAVGTGLAALQDALG